MMAIPRSLLIHSVLHGKLESDRWGDETIKDEQTIDHVRLEPSSKVVRDKNNAELQLNATLFYDCKNSCPRNITFEEDDYIIFNDEKYTVELIEPMYDGKRLHHIEMGLIKHA